LVSHVQQSAPGRGGKPRGGRWAAPQVRFLSSVWCYESTAPLRRKP